MSGSSSSSSSVSGATIPVPCSINWNTNLNKLSPPESTAISTLIQDCWQQAAMNYSVNPYPKDSLAAIVQGQNWMPRLCARVFLTKDSTHTVGDLFNALNKINQNKIAQQLFGGNTKYTGPESILNIPLNQLVSSANFSNLISQITTFLDTCKDKHERQFALFGNYSESIPAQSEDALRQKIYAHLSSNSCTLHSLSVALLGLTQNTLLKKMMSMSRNPYETRPIQSAFRKETAFTALYNTLIIERKLFCSIEFFRRSVLESIKGVTKDELCNNIDTIPKEKLDQKITNVLSKDLFNLIFDDVELSEEIVKTLTSMFPSIMMGFLDVVPKHTSSLELLRSMYIQPRSSCKDKSKAFDFRDVMDFDDELKIAPSITLRQLVLALKHLTAITELNDLYAALNIKGWVEGEVPSIPSHKVDLIMESLEKDHVSFAKIVVNFKKTASQKQKEGIIPGEEPIKTVADLLNKGLISFSSLINVLKTIGCPFTAQKIANIELGIPNPESPSSSSSSSSTSTAQSSTDSIQQVSDLWESYSHKYKETDLLKYLRKSALFNHKDILRDLSLSDTPKQIFQHLLNNGYLQKDVLRDFFNTQDVSNEINVTASESINEVATPLPALIPENILFSKELNAIADQFNITSTNFTLPQDTSCQSILKGFLTVWRTYREDVSFEEVQSAIEHLVNPDFLKECRELFYS